MKPIVRYRLLLVLIIGMLLYSCQQDDEFLESQQNIKPEIDYSSGAKKLENPYTVATMKKAFENVKNSLTKKVVSAASSSALTANSVPNLDIKASHYYIMFKPQTEEQEGIIKRDTTMFLSDYPLDWEFTDEYLKNRPKLPEGKFPRYWVAVPVSKTLPSDVPYEVLEELYIPEEDPDFGSNTSVTSAKKLTTNSAKTNNEDLLTLLLNEAYTLTGNTDDIIEPTTSVAKTTGNEITKAIWIFGRKWYPSGRIQIWDDNAGTTTTTRRVFSHWQYYDCGGGGIGGPFLEERRVPDESCRRAIYRTETQRVQGKYVPLVGAQVLMRQWFTVRQGITDHNGYFRTGSVRGKARYKIQWERYHYSIRNGSLFQAETRGPRVKSQAWNHNIRGGEDEYHGMIHTAAHAYYYGSRFGLTSPPRNSFFKRQIKIAAGNKQLLRIDQANHYTSAGWDMIDDFNQRSYGNSYPIDRVSGYTIKQLEDGLISARYWTAWRNSIKHLHDNDTEQYLDELFANWQD